MIDRRKGLSERIKVGGEGTMEFSELGLDVFRDCRDFKVIVGNVVGEVPRSVKDSADGKLDAIDVG